MVLGLNDPCAYSEGTSTHDMSKVQIWRLLAMLTLRHQSSQDSGACLKINWFFFLSVDVLQIKTFTSELPCKLHASVILPLLPRSQTYQYRC